MSYRNKTYVIFDADEDIKCYRLMTAWKANKKIDFNFYDAHDINNLMKKGQTSDEQIYKKLRERMNNAKQVIVLVGEKTKNLYKFVRWEINLAIEKDLPIIAVNLDNSNGSTDKTPPILKNEAYFVSVPFELEKIKFALDDFPEHYKNKKELIGDLSYDWKNIKL